MKINSELVKSLRSERQWSQEQLGEACGLNLRTIQRLENTGKASLESIRALAAVFEIPADDLSMSDSDEPVTAVEAVKMCCDKFADFSGTASRAEYWWFVLFVVLVAAVAQVIHLSLLTLVSIISFIPLLAAGTRRLRDTGQSPWWQLMFIVPFGFVLPVYLLARASHDQPSADENKENEELASRTT